MHLCDITHLNFKFLKGASVVPGFLEVIFGVKNRDIFKVSTSDLEIAIFQVVGFDGLVTARWGQMNDARLLDS